VRCSDEENNFNFTKARQGVPSSHSQRTRFDPQPAARRGPASTPPRCGGKAVSGKCEKGVSMTARKPSTPLTERVRTIPGLSEEQVRAVRELIQEVVNKAVLDRLNREKRKNEREREQHLRQLEAIEAEFRSQLSKIATYELREADRRADLLAAQRFLDHLRDEKALSNLDKYSDWKQAVFGPIPKHPNGPDEEDGDADSPLVAVKR
jgi:hypothetical protein